MISSKKWHTKEIIKSLADSHSRKVILLADIISIFSNGFKQPTEVVKFKIPSENFTNS